MISWRITRKFFPGNPFFCMSCMKCLSKYPYLKKHGLHRKISGCAPVTFNLTFHPNFHPNILVFANLPIYKKLIHDNIQTLRFENQESFQTTSKSPRGELTDISPILKVESTLNFPRRIDVIIPRGFTFQNRCNSEQLSTWNFDVESMAIRGECVHWDVSIAYTFF